MRERADFQDFTTALYEVISQPSGQRDWDRISPLYHPDARMVRTGIDENGESFAKVMSLDQYIANAESLLANVSFFEKELTHQVTIFGNVAQLASVYEFQYRSEQETREGRGVNFFTLINDGQRWQIMSIVWDNEREGLVLPD